MVRSAAVLAALAAWPRSTADMYDVLMPHYLPPAECGAAGCAAWSGQDPRVWRAGAPPDNAGDSCAMPAGPILDSRFNKTTETLNKATNTSWQGAWCYCKDPSAARLGVCRAPSSVPEQINLQIAGPDVVVVAFVTYDPQRPSAPPVAVLDGTQITGVSHFFER